MKIPQHIAIIMDGNGRWAKRRFLTKQAGHRAGAQALKQLALDADEMGLKYLTAYVFSTENWSRPNQEVDDIMDLLRKFVQEYTEGEDNSNVRMRVIGDRTGLAPDIQESIEHLENITQDRTGLCVILAINYGGRDEITRAVKRIVKESVSGRTGDINEKLISSYLDTAEFPDPELLVRTSGEMRISNFLTWQCSYAEFVVLDVLWPDFTIKHLKQAIEVFNKRNRRFGGRR